MSLEVRELIWQQSQKDSQEGLNLVVKEGDLICLTGKTGAGKTTLVDTILGLHPFSHGEIKLDRGLISGLYSKLNPEYISHVTQDVPIFDGTLESNIISGYISDLDWLNKVLEVTQLQDFVEAHENGLQYDVSNKFLAMSGGERQRIGLARAIYSKPRLLILDEATNGLDEETESNILASIRKLPWRPTILAITHKSSLMALADKVLKLEKGLLAEIQTGSPDEQ